eukprot:g9212.t1
MRFPPPGHSVGHQRVENYTSGGSSGSGGTSRPPAHHPGHPEWHGSVPDKWMDRNTGRTISRRIVYTAARNGPADSLARNGFSYGCLPYVKPPHLIRKEELEGVKWTKKPGFIGPNGYGPDRKLQKLQRRHFHDVAAFCAECDAMVQKLKLPLSLGGVVVESDIECADDFADLRQLVRAQLEAESYLHYFFSDLLNFNNRGTTSCRSCTEIIADTLVTVWKEQLECCEDADEMMKVVSSERDTSTQLTLVLVLDSLFFDVAGVGSRACWHDKCERLEACIAAVLRRTAPPADSETATTQQLVLVCQKSVEPALGRRLRGGRWSGSGRVVLLANVGERHADLIAEFAGCRKHSFSTAFLDTFESETLTVCGRVAGFQLIEEEQSGGCLQGRTIGAPAAGPSIFAKAVAANRGFGNGMNLQTGGNLSLPLPPNLQQGGSSSSTSGRTNPTNVGLSNATATARGGAPAATPGASAQPPPATSHQASSCYPGYEPSHPHFAHLQEVERLRASPPWETLSEYKKKFFVGQKLHETPPDEWKTLDPRVTKSIPEMSEKWRLVASFLEARGLISCQLESFNSFVSQGIRDIVFSKSNVEIRCDVDPNWFVRFTDIQIGRPQMIDDRSLQDLDVYPQQCRLRDLTYCAPIYVSYYYYAGKNAAQPTMHPQPLQLGHLPIMLRSANCHLSGRTNGQPLSDHELMQMGECPLDPGGYFIIDGTEKVLMMQENMSNNRIIVEKAAKGSGGANSKPPKLQAAVTSSTNDNKSRVVIGYAGARNVLTLKHSKFQNVVNVVCVIKAMGVVHDQEIFQMIGRGGAGSSETARFITQLLPSFQEAKDLGVFTQQQALEYLGKQMKDRFISSRAASATGPNAAPLVSKAQQARLALEIVFSHVQQDKKSSVPMLPKVRYLCIMIRRIFDAEANPSHLVDDKDYYGNKRIEQASSMMSMLFEDIFKTLSGDVRKRADLEIGKLVQGKTNNYTDVDILKRTVLESSKVTQTFKYALKSGNWKIQRFRVDRSGVSQVLSRFSYMIALGSMTKVKSNVEKSHKIAGPRALQPSQWGMLCPADTPEGEQCGLIKNLSLMATVSTGLGDKAMERMKPVLRGLGVLSPDLLSGDELTPDSVETLLVFFNGNLLGACRNPKQLIADVKELRRQGLIFQFTSIYHHENTKTINIACDEGRLFHVPKLTGDKKWSFHDFLINGVVEFVDVNEENNLLIAMRPEEITKDHTHLEIEPLTLLGIISGLVAYPNHNQSPRNTYTCAMGKQAMGCIAYNQFHRSDNVFMKGPDALYLLNYPQKPLTKSKTLDFANFDRFGAGINASVAVISYSGYDIEDAIVMNKASVDRGFGR